MKVLTETRFVDLWKSAFRVAPIALWLGTALIVSGCDDGAVSVTTQRYDNGRTGQNLSETILNTSNVGQSTFGKLFSRAVDDQVYAQPLYVSNVAVPNVGIRNALYAATMSNTVYAFDADDPAAAEPLWRVNLNGTVPGAQPVRFPCSDISGNIGIVGTPAIDETTQTLYVVARTKENGTFVQRLHALDIASGSARPNSPTVIHAKVAGAGAGSVSGFVSFSPKLNNQRGSLLIANGMLYITWAAHCDRGPYHGWIMAYDLNTLKPVFAKAITPNGLGGGIWQGGAGPSAAASGNVYFTVGNGTTTAQLGGQDYGSAFIKMAPLGKVVDWFIPYNYKRLNKADIDLGASGVLLIPNTNLLASAGVEGKLYVLDRFNLGHLHEGSDSQIVQSLVITPGHPGCRNTPTYWNGPGGPYVYIWCARDRGKAFQLSGGLLTTTPASLTNMVGGDYTGGSHVISANKTTAGSGILWVTHELGNANHHTVPGVLRAFDATDLSHELWNSLQNAARDDYGNFAKYSTPIVANGKVYVPTFSQQIAVYGLLPEGRL